MTLYVPTVYSVSMVNATKSQEYEGQAEKQKAAPLHDMSSGIFVSPSRPPVVLASGRSIDVSAINRTELARASGVHVATISRYLSKSLMEPSLWKARRVAEALDMTLDEFMEFLSLL